MLRKKDVIAKLNTMPLPSYMVKDFTSLIEEMDEVDAIPISFIATRVLKLQKLVDFERYEDDQYDTPNYHKLIGLRELVDEWTKVNRSR